MRASWLGQLQAEPHFPLSFQKSGPVQKGPRYVELVLVADNQEVKWGQLWVPVGFLFTLCSEELKATLETSL